MSVEKVRPTSLAPVMVFVVLGVACTVQPGANSEKPAQTAVEARRDGHGNEPTAASQEGTEASDLGSRQRTGDGPEGRFDAESEGAASPDVGDEPDGRGATNRQRRSSRNQESSPRRRRGSDGKASGGPEAGTSSGAPALPGVDGTPVPRGPSLGTPSNPSPPRDGNAGPGLALIYKGPTSCDGCETAIVDLLKKCDARWTTRYVGPGGEVPISPEVLAGASLYAQPGGDGSPQEAFKNPTQDMAAIKQWVQNGGHYLGFCLGAYYAGSWGFNMLPGDSGSYIESRGADIHGTEDTLVRVVWRGVPRSIFFQEGAIMTLRPGAQAEVLARYQANNGIAAMVSPFGRGKVGVSGPHPEAVDWGVPDPDGDDTAQGCDLVKTLMAP